MPDSAELHVISGTRWFLFAELVSGVCAVCGVLAFTRLVAPDIYGAYSVTMAASGLVLSLTAEWLQFACLRLLPGVRREINQATLVCALVLLGACGQALATLGAVTAVIVSAGSETKQLIAAAWSYVLLGTVFMVGTTVFQARIRARAFAIYRSLFAILRIVSALCLLVWLRVSPVMMVAGNTAALLMLLPPLVWALRQPVRIQRSRVRVYVRRIVRFGGPMIGWLLASQILNISDRFLIQKFKGNFDVGVYAVTYALVAGIATACLQPILYGAFPSLVRSHHQLGGPETGSRFNRVLVVYLLVVPPVLVGICLLGADLIAALADPAYDAPQALITVLAFGIVLWNLSLYLQKALELTMRSVSLLRYLGFAAGVNVAANLGLIPLLGIMGAAVGTLASYALYCALVLREARRSYHISVPVRSLVSVSAGVAAMVLLLLAGRSLTGDLPALIRVLVCGLPALLVYVLILRYRGELRNPGTRRAGSRS